jgi:xylan 1,4-beta-xylosidase
VGATAASRRVVLKFVHTDARSASVESLDAEHGNVRNAYEQMGAPRYPTQEQLVQLRAAAAVPPPLTRQLESGSLTLEIPADGLTLVTVANSPRRAE